MSDKERQCLIALSSMSYLGPYYDINALRSVKFYKNKKKDTLHLNNLMEKECDLSMKNRITSMLRLFGIEDQATYIGTLEKLIKGSDFTKDMTQFIHKIRMEHLTGRNKLIYQNEKISFNHGQYDSQFAKTLMKCELHKPVQGLRAFDLANAVLLLRLSYKFPEVKEETLDAYYNEIANQVFSNYKDFSSFGKDASIGRHIYLSYRFYLEYRTLPNKVDSIFATSYYSIWQYIDWPKN